MKSNVCALVAGVLVAVVASGCLGGSGTNLSIKVSQWEHSASEGAAIDTVISDESRILAMLNVGSSGGIRTDCDVLHIDAQQANANLPSPDTQITSDLGYAFGDDGSAAEACMIGASGSKPYLSQAKTEILAADAEYLAAANQYKSILGKQLLSAKSSSYLAGVVSNP